MLIYPRSLIASKYRDALAAKVRRIRPYDFRHTFASLLIAAGKDPLYIARQMGHYSAGFTLDTYGHLMEALPRRQVEFIDELVFPEGWEAALKLHLYGALPGATACSPVQSPKELEPASDVAFSDLVQLGAAGGNGGDEGIRTLLPLFLRPPPCAIPRHWRRVCDAQGGVIPSSSITYGGRTVARR